MAELDAAQRLHVLIANEHAERLGHVEGIVRSLGYDVIAHAVDPARVGGLTREYHPDVALVGLGDSSEHALALIEGIVQTATCPVITLLHSPDPEFVAHAARRGIFASVTEETPAELQSAIEIVLQRFAAFRNLEGAFGRRALIERAKGILMERHRIGERDAFELLRGQSQRTGRKLAEIAGAVNDSHLLLPGATAPGSTGDEASA